MKSFLQALLLTSVCVSTIAASDNVLFLNESATIPMMQIRTPDAPRKARALNAGDVASSGSDFNQGNSDTDDVARRLDFSDSESNPGDQSSVVVIRGLDFSDPESRDDELFTGSDIITPRPYAVADQNRPGGPSHARLGIVQHSDSEIETTEPATPTNRRFSAFPIRLSQNIPDLTSNTDDESNRQFVPLPQDSSDSESVSDQAITDTSEVDSDLDSLGLAPNDLTTPRAQIIPVQNLSNTYSDQEYSYSDQDYSYLDSSGYYDPQPHNTLNLINVVPARGNLRPNLSSESSIHQRSRS